MTSSTLDRPRYESVLARGHDLGEASPPGRRELAEDGVADAVSGHAVPDGDDGARDIRPDHPMLRPERRRKAVECRADDDVDVPRVERDRGDLDGDFAGTGYRSRDLGEAHDVLGRAVAVEHDRAHEVGCGGHAMSVSTRALHGAEAAVTIVRFARRTHRSMLAAQPEVRDAARMRKPVLITIGAIVAVMGVVFMFQGLGVIGGSAMTGSTLWAILGPIIALVGIVLVVVGLRRKT